MFKQVLFWLLLESLYKEIVLRIVECNMLFVQRAMDFKKGPFELR